MSRVLVIGGNGVLGADVSAALERHHGVEVVKGSRSADPEQARRVDVGSSRSVEDAITGMDAVVVAVPQDEPRVQRACADQHTPCVDLTPDGRLREMARVELAQSPIPLVMMCGFYPGLSGLLAHHVSKALDEVHRVDVGLLQSTNARVGPAGVQDMLRAVSRPVDDRGAPGFHQKLRMEFGPRHATVRRIGYDEARVVSAHLQGADVRYHTAWDSRRFTMAVAVMCRLKILPAVLRSPLDLTPRHRPGRAETVWLTAEAHGVQRGTPAQRRVCVEARSDYGATAAVTAAVVEHVLQGIDALSGVLNPFDVMTLADLHAAFASGEVGLLA